MKMDEQFIRAWINPRNVSVARRIEVDTIPKEAYSPFLAIHLISVTFDRRQERTSGIIGLTALLHEFLLLRSIVLYFISAAGSLYDNLARKRSNALLHRASRYFLCHVASLSVWMASLWTRLRAACRVSRTIFPAKILSERSRYLVSLPRYPESRRFDFIDLFLGWDPSRSTKNISWIISVVLQVDARVSGIVKILWNFKFLRHRPRWVI